VRKFPENRTAPQVERAAPTTASHGADVAAQWADELDREALRFVLSSQLPKRVAVDLGCGVGTQGVRFALLGCKSLLYDIVDMRERIERISQMLELGDLEFRCIDLREVVPEDFPERIGVVYSQRFLHHLPFHEASRLLDMFAGRLCTNGRLFVSASGLASELGIGYAEADKAVEHRFAPLAAAMQAKHGIRYSVCLYAIADLERLVLPRGFRTIRTWSSPFGNVKGVFERV
jgi:trans-aconitate methyltransferase